MNIKIPFNIYQYLLAIGYFALCSYAYANEPQQWYTTARLTWLSTTYNNTQIKQQQNSGRLLLGVDYLDQTQFQFASSFSTFSFKDNSPNYTQNSYALFGKQYFYTDFLQGRTGLQLGYLTVTGKNLKANNIYNAAIDHLIYSGKIYFRTITILAI